jgi:hypothetical protein
MPQVPQAQQRSVHQIDNDRFMDRRAAQGAKACESIDGVGAHIKALREANLLVPAPPALLTNNLPSAEAAAATSSFVQRQPSGEELVVNSNSKQKRPLSKATILQKRKTLFLKMQESGEAAIVLDAVCTVLFQQFLDEFAYASKHVCGTHTCAKAYSCKFLAYNLWQSFQYMTNMASVNKKCKEVVGALILHAQQSRLMFYQNLLETYQPSRTPLPRANFNTTHQALQQTEQQVLQQTEDNMLKEMTATEEKKPVYISLFQAFFGLLWKFDVLDALCKDKLADYRYLPGYTGNHNLPACFQ